jgi:hypothetical protein
MLLDFLATSIGCLMGVTANGLWNDGLPTRWPRDRWRNVAVVLITSIPLCAAYAFIKNGAFS